MMTIAGVLVRNKKHEDDEQEMRTMNKKVHCVLAIIAGVIALIAGLTGSIGLYEPLLALTTAYAPAEVTQILVLVLLILGVFASLGGIVVILGGLLIFANRFFIGRLCISFGIGFEAMEFVFNIIVVAIGGDFIIALMYLISVLATLIGLAFVLSLVALMVPISKD